MLPFKRSSPHIIDRWFFTINKPIMVIVLSLCLIGVFLNLTVSPYVALRLRVDPLYFFYRHLIYLFLSIIVLIIVTFLNKQQVIKLATLIFMVSFIAILLVLGLHLEVKGAKRWIHVFGFSLQPSEFLKVCFPIVIARVWELYYARGKFMLYFLITVIYAMVVTAIVMQPDLGMAILISLTFGALLFLSGISIVWILLFAIVGVLLLLGAYFTFSHVHYRVDNFFNSTKSYQIMKAIEAIQNGGFLGVGPGKGYYKQYLPDAHTDFVFAVAIEEYGLIFALLLIGLFGYLGYLVYRLLKRTPLGFIYLSSAGLIIILILQLLIHVSSNINLIPTKGMPLPFISYGGSSLMSNSLLIGFLIALNKKQY